MTIPHDDRRMGESELRNINKDKDENFFFKKANVYSCFTNRHWIYRAPALELSVSENVWYLKMIGKFTSQNMKMGNKCQNFSVFIKGTT